MYCPKCAAQNIEGAKFCRGCGTDISLVPQALTGTLPALSEEAEILQGKHRKKKALPMEKVMENIFIGIAFLLIVLGGAVFFTKGFIMWIWFLIPGFTMVGKGVGQYLSLRQETPRPTPRLPFDRHEITSTPPRSVAAPATGELAPNMPLSSSINSVTEGTTRLLDEIPARDSVNDVPRTNVKIVPRT